MGALKNFARLSQLRCESFASDLNQSRSKVFYFLIVAGSLQPPWLWAVAIDHRRPSEERVELKNQLWELGKESNELTDEWFHDVLISMFVHRDAMGDPQFEFGLYLWACGNLATNAGAGAEYQHGRDCRRSNQSQNWQNFVAYCRILEACQGTNQQIKAAVFLGGDGGGSKRKAGFVLGACDCEEKQVKRRKRSLWDIARDDVAENMKSLGQKVRRDSVWFLKLSSGEMKRIASTPPLLAIANVKFEQQPHRTETETVAIRRGASIDAIAPAYNSHLFRDV